MELRNYIYLYLLIYSINRHSGQIEFNHNFPQIFILKQNTSHKKLVAMTITRLASFHFFHFSYI